VEGFDVPKQAKLVKRTIDLDGCWRPVRRRRPQTKAIIDRYAKPSEQCAREAAETLPGRNGVVAMVPIFGELAFNAVLSHRTYSLADVVMRTNEDQVIGVIEEMPDRINFRRCCRLMGAQRVETDHHDAIDTVEPAIERRHCAIIGDAFDLNDRTARQRFGLFGEGLEIRFLDVVQKARDALIDMAAIRQAFECRVKKSAQFEYRWKAIVDDKERRTGLRGSAPCEIEKYLSTAHPYLILFIGDLLERVKAC
jgi:hypothetical protein